MSDICKIFIVEDDLFYCGLLGHYLALNADNEVHKFTDAKSFLQAITKIRPHIITVDYNLPDHTGYELLKKIKEFDSSINVIIISGQEDVKIALSLLKEGAYDYFIKDEDTNEKLWNCVNKINETRKLKSEIDGLKSELKSKYKIDTILKGNSEQMTHVHRLIEKATKTNINVSITGETGTGKELVAKAIHFNSSYSNRPFVAINVAAIPSELIESELFGFEKGSFTGAQNRKIGKLEEANEGTLFLDEISEMNINLQAKLLRAIQEREITRVGGNQVIKLNFRLIVATQKNLLNEVKLGRFREDLYYRLYGFPIELPRLHSRGQDILLLANYFLANFCFENKMASIEISKEAKEKLIKYLWPGNVRELKAVVELAAVMADKNIITENIISFGPIDSEEKILKHEMTLEEYQREIVQSYLKKYNNNVVLVAQKLKMGKSTIYNMLQKREV
ncbi:MAG: sigma-54 dependent transcriptional regulator [Bacteroidetes bacterium]|nr:sigma-54 dependent transcriptional regulator [Bacteroidota bacterium]